MTINFKLRRPDQIQTSLYVEFKKNGQKIVLFPGKVIQTEFWHIDNQACKKNHPCATEMNLFLKTWKGDLEKIVLSLETQKEFISKERIQEELDKVYKPVIKEEGAIKDFIDFMDSVIESKKAKKREVQKLEQTRKLVIIGFNLITKRRLDDWEKLGIKQKSKSILTPDYKLKFNTIDLKFIEKFRDYLYTAKYKTKIKGVEVYQNYKINYIDKQIKGLKQFLLAAIEAKYVQPFTWKSIESEEIEVDSVYTNFSEIQAVYDTHLTHPTEIKVRDKYVLNCFFGMRYGDLNNLANHLFLNRSINGQDYVIYTGRQQKTDNKIEFAIHPMAIEMLEKYDYSMPKLSLKEFNEVLKRVAFKAGLTSLERIREIRGTKKIVRDVPKYELMSSHAGRRSFCTNFTEAGVPIESIMSISGHKTEEEFRKYIKKPSVNIEVVATQIHAIKGLRTKLRVA